MVPDLKQISPIHTTAIYFSEIISSIILPLSSRFYSCFNSVWLSFGFLCYSSVMRVTFPVQPILFYFIIVIGEEYKL
jgi:hypothetical protein